MKLAPFLFLLTLVSSAYAHYRVAFALINGELQGESENQMGVYIRSPDSNDPITNVDDLAMTCGTDNNSAVNETLEVEGGDILTSAYRRIDDTTNPYMSSGHWGPVMVYIASDGTGDMGAVWSKIYQFGYETADDGEEKWGNTMVLENEGELDIEIPDLIAGNYLLRVESLAIHQVDDGGPYQFYISCIQIHISGDGTLVLPDGVKFPGEYNEDDPGIYFFESDENNPNYQCPGPDVLTWDSATATVTATEDDDDESATVTATNDDLDYDSATATATATATEDDDDDESATETATADGAQGTGLHDSETTGRHRNSRVLCG